MLMPRTGSEREECEPYKKGDVIGGKYEILGTLGKGGFGVVLLAHSRDTGEVCALKTFRDELLADPAAREEFKKEALLWVNLDTHPFIIPAWRVDEVFGRLFVAMEYIVPDAQRRVTLADHLASTVGPFETSLALKWGIQFCLGMEHARAHGVQFHRDIKPDNILITQDGTLKISDFGLASGKGKIFVGAAGIGTSTEGSSTFILFMTASMSTVKPINSPTK
jgi:serine/threonine protein kinase